MKSETQSTATHGQLTLGYAKAGEVVAATFFTILVLGFYTAHYVGSTGFFTSAFTPLLAGVFYATILYTIVNAIAKATIARKDIVTLVELIGAVLLTVTAAWFFVVFPLNFAHVAEVVPGSLQFLLSWITNDIGRILVALVLLASLIALSVDTVKLAWRVSVRRFRNVHEVPAGM